MWKIKAPGFRLVAAGGRLCVRRTMGRPRTLVRLWDKNPAMMIPGYRPQTREVDLRDL